MEHADIFIGKYNIANRAIFLYLNVNIIIENNSYVIIATIPIPDNYPNTLVGRSQTIQDQGLFSSRLSFASDNNAWFD